MTFSRIKSVPILLLILVLSCHSSYANVRIISYNIKDLWLRFDGEPGGITNEGSELDKDDLEKNEIVAGVIRREKPYVARILECASLAQLLFVNERFLEGEYRRSSLSKYRPKKNSVIPVTIGSLWGNTK